MIPTEARRQIAAEELEEQFPNAPLQEVSFEARFVPKLRIPSEIWKLQEALAETYPIFGQEATISINPGVGSAGLIPYHFFSSRDGTNRISASHGNFAILMKRYPGFQGFLREVIDITETFSASYEISVFTRVGLRYNNQFILPGERSRLEDFVNPFVDFTRVNLRSTNQFVVELRGVVNDHQMTTRTALLDDPALAYVLDMDCYTDTPSRPSDVEALVRKFHHSAKVTFLQHIKPALKEEFRRRPK
jgi:uncharacterized protein (TIGR04255 family)